MDYVVMVAEDETYCHKATDRLSTFQTIEYHLERLSFAPKQSPTWDSIFMKVKEFVCLLQASHLGDPSTPITKSQVQEFLESVEYC